MTSRDLQDFLQEAQLEHYNSALKNELKVTCVDHLKYVKEEDLEHIGMARPEIRRLRKYYKKECPQGTFGKLRKVSRSLCYKSFSVISHSHCYKSFFVISHSPL